MSITSDWNSNQKQLKEFIRNADHFEEAKELFLTMHGSVHSKQITNGQNPTIMDEIWHVVKEQEFSIMPTSKDVTIAWDIWHITRIEDLTINMLVNQSIPVLTTELRNELEITITDTGNAMSDDAIMEFSKRINIGALKKYRDKVGLQTQKILNNLTQTDMKRKIVEKDCNRILELGGVLKHPDSIWLLDFWGKKDVAGIILMPITRHQIVHLNDCFKLKNSIERKKEYFRS